MATLSMTKKRVLFVDDEPQVLGGFRLTLRQATYEVLTASSASEALEIIARNAISVVVSDEDMPGQRGAELLKKVASYDPDMVLMVLTGCPSLDVAVDVINSARVFRFLHKPCSPEVLRTHIDDALVEYERRQTASRFRTLVAEEAQRIRHDLPQTVKAPYIERLQTRLSSGELAALSPREVEVIEQLVEGRRVRQLASDLFISPHTVRNHLKSIFNKLGVHSQSELIDKCKA